MDLKLANGASLFFQVGGRKLHIQDVWILYSPIENACQLSVDAFIDWLKEQKEKDNAKTE